MQQFSERLENFEKLISLDKKENDSISDCLAHIN
jgi:hypothetical protein